MRFHLRKLLILVFLLYIFFTIYSALNYLLLPKENISENNFRQEIHLEDTGVRTHEIKDIHIWGKDIHIRGKDIHIWGKAAIAEYFWDHIFEGNPTNVPNKLLKTDFLEYSGLKFHYKSGPYLTYFTANQKVEHLVLILNGREPTVVMSAKKWFHELLDNGKFLLLKNLGVIILGNELCRNDWLIKIYYKHRKIFKFIFVVYDIPNEENIYQWPLGVATYRNFPLISKNNIDESLQRQYRCNFLGTVYPNSSRIKLIDILKTNTFNCFTKVRYTWVLKEPRETKSLYHDILKDSDLTLCPVGVNSESYRIYEALSYGSVPVIENKMTPGSCGNGEKDNAPFRILKEFNAPVIFIHDWDELPQIIEAEKRLSFEAIVDRRRNVLSWYEIFRHQMREHFVSVLKDSFM